MVVCRQYLSHWIAYAGQLLAAVDTLKVVVHSLHPAPTGSHVVQEGFTMEPRMILNFSSFCLPSAGITTERWDRRHAPPYSVYVVEQEFY